MPSPEMTEDMVPVPRSVARAALTDMMSDISEDCWAASWMCDTALSIWLCLSGKSKSKVWSVNDWQKTRLIILARGLGEWPDPKEGSDAWAPLAEMEKAWGALQL